MPVVEYDYDYASDARSRLKQVENRIIYMLPIFFQKSLADICMIIALDRLISDKNQ